MKNIILARLREEKKEEQINDNKIIINIINKFGKINKTNLIKKDKLGYYFLKIGNKFFKEIESLNQVENLLKLYGVKKDKW